MTLSALPGPRSYRPSVVRKVDGRWYDPYCETPAVPRSEVLAVEMGQDEAWENHVVISRGAYNTPLMFGVKEKSCPI